MELKRGIIIVSVATIFIIVCLTLTYFLIIGRSCRTMDCFEKSADKCFPTRIYKISNGNIFYYRIRPSLGKVCKLEIKIKELSIDSPIELKNLFEGKSMHCKIPKEIFSSEFIELGKSMDYCTGPLKEAMYELMIQRMYDLSVKQMSGVVSEMEKALK